MEHQQTSWPFRLNIPYDDSRNFEGFWGQKTVTLNFCEEVSLRLVVVARRLSRKIRNPTPPCPVTSMTDQTTKDYVVSYYIAEVCNVSCSSFTDSETLSAVLTDSCQDFDESLVPMARVQGHPELPRPRP